MNEFLNPNTEQESKKAKYRQGVNLKIQELLRAGGKLAHVATLLGAQDYLTLEQSGHTHGAVANFQVEQFINDQIERGTYLKLPGKFTQINRTVLPPDDLEIQHGSGKSWEKRKDIPRTQFVAEVLGEMDLEYEMIEGFNSSNMAREISYDIFVIPSIRKALLVNNEGENATFVVHNLSIEEDEINYILSLTKSELAQLGETKVDVLNYTGNEKEWKIKVQELLLKSVVELENSEVQTENAPDGWMTKYTLAKLLDIDPSTVVRFVEKLKSNYPDQIKKFYSKTAKKNMDYYSPKIVAFLKKSLESREKAPEGWVTMSSLSNELDVAYSVLKRITKPYRKTNKDLFKDYMDARDRVFEHCHPYIAEIIRKEVKSVEKAPEGWITVGEMAQKLSVNYTTVERVVKKYKTQDKYKDDWKNYSVKTDKVARYYYSSKFFDIVSQEIESKEKAPEGWEANSELATELQRDWRTILKIAKEFRKENGDWFKIYVSKNNQKREYYHPDLIKKIKERVNLLK